MKKLRKILCFVIPCILVIAITLGIVLPLTLNRDDKKQVSSFESVLADETGASSADRSKKGGAIFLEEDSTYYMSGGTISGSKNTYGGAVFVSSGATFTMEGGTITGCSAKYGGAIYVASGGTCTINGGKIFDNTAEVAPAIYVEEGGRLTIVGDPEISKNTFGKFIPYALGPDTVLGAVTNQTILKTILFGTYPKTYVGDDMNATLESWFSLQNPTVIKTYTIDSDGTWNAYKYTDGNIYVRGKVLTFDIYSVYKNGTVAVDGRDTWFKVESITWYILNYDKWESGSENMELYSELAIASGVCFENSNGRNYWQYSDIRSWCNNKFYEEAFDDSEKTFIKQSTIGNNLTDGWDDDTLGNATTDNIYLKSIYELEQEPFTDDYSRIAANSDFAIGNNALNMGNAFTTAYRKDGFSAWYWLRSAGAGDSSACIVSNDGYIGDFNSITSTYFGIRPALRLNI